MWFYGLHTFLPLNVYTSCDKVWHSLEHIMINQLDCLPSTILLRLLVMGLKLSGSVSFPDKKTRQETAAHDYISDVIVCLLQIVYLVVYCFVHILSLVWAKAGFRIIANCSEHAVLWWIAIGNGMHMRGSFPQLMTVLVFVL